MARESKYLPFFMNIQLGSAQKKLIFLANTLTLYPSQKPKVSQKNYFEDLEDLLELNFNSDKASSRHSAFGIF